MSRSISHTLGVGFLLALLVVHLTLSASAQAPGGEAPPPRQMRTANVTAAVSGDVVRFAARGQAAQMRLEVYGEGGEKVYDSDYRRGSILDWRAGGEVGAAGLADGAYLLVVTLQDLGGRLRQRLGTAEVGAGRLSVRPAEALQLTVGQRQALAVGRASQAIDEAEGEEASLAVLPEGATPSMTVTAHDGQDGQVTSTTGALTFRTGDVFSGKDVERVRITPEGNVGIGTDKPQVKLDVAGMIRAGEGLMFSDGSTLKVNEKGVLTRTSADGASPSSVTSTQNRLAKFTDSVGTLGNSNVTEAASGKLGIGTVNPNYEITLFGNDVGLQLISPGTGATAADGFRFGISSVNNAFLWNAEATDMYFGTSATERMRIKANGNVGIGTGTPAHKLDVGGEINTSGDYYSGNVRVLSVTGPFNTFVGDDAGSTNAGSGNSFFGDGAGEENLGNSNSFFGRAAGDFNKEGIENSFFGRFAGRANATGSNNTTFGYSADLGAADLNNATAIGSKAFVAANNSLVLGSVNGVNSAASDTKVGIGTTTPAAMLDIQSEGISAFQTTTYGNDNLLTFRAAGGTRAAPTATTFGQALMSLSSTGHTGSAFNAVHPVAINFNATENWTSGATGAGMSFWTGQNGTGTSSRRMTITHDGNVGIGTGFPSNTLHVLGSIDGSATPEKHVALIQNSSPGTSADVLALQIGRNTAPETSNNYITFFKGDDTTAGAIQGNGSGSVVLAGAGADYAEWLPRLNLTEQIQPGEIVGLFEGRITKQTRGAAQVMAISTGPIVLGNDPGERARGGFERVAFIGQVMVRVRGTVQAGDFIVASGLEDGTGVGVSPDRITAAEFEQVVGQSWETSANPSVKSVRVAVGLIRRDPTVGRLIEYSRNQTARIAALEARLTAFEAGLQSKTAARNLSAGAGRKQRQSARAMPRELQTRNQEGAGSIVRRRYD